MHATARWALTIKLTIGANICRTRRPIWINALTICQIRLVPFTGIAATIVSQLLTHEYTKLPRMMTHTVTSATKTYVPIPGLTAREVPANKEDALLTASALFPPGGFAAKASLLTNGNNEIPAM